MGPIDSWRVVDLTDLRGALCGRMLADLGADVVRVEPPPDPRRPPPEEQPIAAAYRHANKHRSPVDPSDQEALDALLATADILVENLDGARAALGLEPDAVRARHPHLIHVAIADFGLTGPRAGWRLEPLTAQAAGGTLFASGFPGRAPCWFPGYLGPDCASVYAAAGAVAAYMDRRRHGRGQTVEVSVQEATLSGTNPWSVAIQDYLKINPFLPAEGKRNADGFYWVLPAADGWVRTVIGNDKQWRGLVHLIGDPEVLTAPEWSEALFRRMNADVARMVAADLMRDRTRAELFEQARRLGATTGMINRPSEYPAHPQAEFRDVFASSALPGLEGGPEVRPPLRFSRTPGARKLQPIDDQPPEWAARPGAGDETPGSPPLLLDGVRVVEFGMAAVGPEASLVLSELGADVLKIESSVHLDVLRQSGFDRINCGFAFNSECRGRRSVALNLDTEEGRALAFRLCAAADVVIENYRGGVLDTMGLGYEEVKAANPGVVYASSQGYGRGGPLGEMPAYGPLNLGFIGLHLLWNHPDAEYPCGTSLNHPDHVAGKFLAAGILAALDHRSGTGEGQHIELAQTEFAAFLRGEVYLEGWLAGADPGPLGNASPIAAPHGVYPAEGDDKWVAVVCASDADWQALCQVAGWPSDPDLATVEARLSRVAEVEARLSEWTAARPAAETAALLQRAGVSACPVMGPLDHLDDEHLVSRGYFDHLKHPEAGDERHAGNPVRMSLSAQRVAPSAPCLGVDTVEVLAEVLGITAEEVARLVEAGVCI